MFNLEKANKAVAALQKRIKAGEIKFPTTVEELDDFAKSEGWSEERTLNWRKRRFPTQDELDAIKTV